MKKRIFAFLMALALGLSMAGCSNETIETEKEKNEELDDTDVVFSYDDPSEYITIPEDYMGIEVTGYEEITDVEVMQQIGFAKYTHMRKEQIMEGTVKEGDKVHVSSKGTLKEEGTVIDMDEYDFTIGDEEMVPGYEDGLIGAEVGDTVHMDLTFADDYYNTALQGKEASFEVTIQYICGAVSAPDWTDEFVQEITNGEFKNTEDYEVRLREELQANKNQEIYYTQQADIIHYLVENSVVHKFPEGLVEEQYEIFVREYERQNEENYGYENFEDYILTEVGYSTMDEFYNDMQKNAEDAATELLAYQAIAYKENITLTKGEYDYYLQTFASSEGYTTASKFEEDYMSAYLKRYEDEDFLNKKFLNRKVLEILQANAKSTPISAGD